MAILKFRAYLEEDDSVYRDVAIRHKQTFFELHEAILKAYEFDTKHDATFYRSNDNWQRGREISLQAYNKAYKAPPLMMKETLPSVIFSFLSLLYTETLKVIADSTGYVSVANSFLCILFHWNRLQP